MRRYFEAWTRFNRDTRLHLITPVAIGISYYGLFIVAFNLYLLRLGYDTRFIGVLGAAGTLCFVVMSLPVSAFGRRWGSRRALLLGTGFYLVGFCLLPLTDLLPLGWRTPWLVATFVMGFLGGPFYWVNSNLYIMAVTAPADQPHAFALRTALLPFAGVLGSVVGGAIPQVLAVVTGASLDETGPYRATLLLSGLMYLPAFLATLASSDARHAPEPETAQRSRLPYALIGPILLVELARMAGEVGTYGFFNVYLDERLGVAPVVIGLVAGTALFISGVAALLTPALSVRIGTQRSVALAMVGMAVGLALLAIPRPFEAYLGYCLAMGLSAMSMSALSLYRMQIVGSAWWPAMAGAAVTGQGIGETVVLFAGGFVIAAYGFDRYFLLVAALVGIGAVAFWLRFRYTTVAATAPLRDRRDQPLP
jgi:predicted MFS family arabinose efflux permease